MPALPPPTPSLEFRVWAHEFGINRLARALQVRRTLVNLWLHSRRPIPPKIWNARRICFLSSLEPQQMGPLDLHDIYGPVPKVSRR